MAITGVPDALVGQIIQDSYFLCQKIGINAEGIGFFLQQHRTVRKVVHGDGVAGVQVAHVEQVGLFDRGANGNADGVHCAALLRRMGNLCRNILSGKVTPAEDHDPAAFFIPKAIHFILLRQQFQTGSPKCGKG